MRPAPHAAGVQAVAGSSTEPKGREKELLEKAIGWTGMIYKHNPEGLPEVQRQRLQGPRVGIHRAHGDERRADRGHQQEGSLSTAELEEDRSSARA